jgi:hypothetical protein
MLKGTNVRSEKSAMGFLYLSKQKKEVYMNWLQIGDNIVEFS